MKICILNIPSKQSKNVVRDLFYGCWCQGKRIASAQFPPTTLLSVYTVVKQQVSETSLIDASEQGWSQEETIQYVTDNHFDYVILTTSTMSFREDVHFLQALKEVCNCKTILFGSYVSYLPVKALKHSAVDIIIRYEPEFTLQEICKRVSENKSLSKVKGIGYKDQYGRPKINQDRSFETDLDTLPIPDRTPIVDYRYFNPLVKKKRWVTAITSRGCPGRCTFCTSPTFYGNRYRYNSVERVIDEIKYLLSIGYKEIFYRDETFTGDYKRTEQICKRIIAEKIDVTWICSARVNTVDRPLLSLMKQAGCHMVRFGVETGSQEILNEMKKGTTLEQARRVFSYCNELGLETHGHFMVGCPKETWQSVYRTIDFAKALKPTTVTCGAFTPYLGTPLFDTIKETTKEIDDGSAKDLGTIHNSGYFSSYISDLSDEEVGKAVKLFYRKFYLRPSYILKTLFRLRHIDELGRISSAGFSVIRYIMTKNG